MPLTDKIDLANFFQINLVTFDYALIFSFICILILLLKSRKSTRNKNIQLRKISHSHLKLKNRVNRLSANIKISKTYKSKKQSKINKAKEPIDKEDFEDIKSLKKELNQWKRRVPPLINRYKTLSLENKKLKNELKDAQQIIALSEVMNTPDKTKTVISLNNYRSRDNLQKIRGIGPSTEKTLNKYDIFRYNQIATMNEYEIEEIAKEIKGLKSQIHRENWIGQAELLINQTASEPEKSK